MTAQIQDIYRHKRKKYDLVALSSGRVFDPRDYGLEPHPCITSCWRGHWCEYSITQKGLILKKLRIFNKDDKYPRLNGKYVSPPEFEECEFAAGNKEMCPVDFGHRLYKDLNILIPYTGKVLLGNGFIRDYYVHMGFQNTFAYRELIEFVFENGVLKEKNDLSQIAEAQREAIKRKNIDFRYPDKEDLFEFIEAIKTATDQ